MDGVRLGDPIVRGDELKNPAIAGGKAAALARLGGNSGGSSFNTPAFFVIRAEAITEDGADAATHRAIMAELDQLGAGPFAVRSSGVEEDGAAAAHAGQYATVLNVAAEHVMDAVCAVWRSGTAAHVGAYRRAHGLSAEDAHPAIMVQKMVAPRAAGVAFSVDPVTQRDDVVVMSAVAGLADRLVSGEVTGDQYWWGQDAPAQDAVLAGADPVLSPGEQAGVATLARRAQTHFGAPQDIEWAFEGDTLYLLQSRPITTLTNDVRVDDLIVWDNANIVESYPGIVSVLTFSFAQYVYAHVYKAFARLLGVSPAVVERHAATFDEMLGHIDGRVYYHLLNWYRALALVPGFKTNRAFMEGMMGAEPLPSPLADQLAPPAASWRARVWDRWRLARTGLGLVGHAFTLNGAIKRFYARLNGALGDTDASIQRMSLLELAQAYRRLEAQLLSRWDAPLINDFLCMIAFGAARTTLTKWAGEAGAGLHGDVLIGQGDIISAEPARRIRAMGALAAEAARDDPALIPALGEGRIPGLANASPSHQALGAAFEAYIAKFGDRCAQELKLESVTLHDDPAPLARAVAAAARAHAADGEPSGSTLGSTGDVATRLGALFSGRPVKRRLAHWLLLRAKGRVRDRENLRFERTRVFGRVRRIVLAMADHWVRDGRLAAREDVFLLTIDEVVTGAEGDETTFDAALIAERRAQAEREARIGDPAPRLEQVGETIGPAWRSISPAQASREDDADPRVRKGLACCAGIVQARARVVDDPRTQTLEPGEILVARHTDPGWIAVFANAAGVVAERGSLLSHSAIVAREMGVPCVVALQGATTWLSTGDQIELDGGRGTVRLLDPPATRGGG